MAILGHFFTRFPVFLTPLTVEILLEKFLTALATRAFLFCFLAPSRYKTRRAAHIKKRSMNSSCRHFQPG
jgi:hypothetical protein